MAFPVVLPSGPRAADIRPERVRVIASVARRNGSGSTPTAGTVPFTARFFHESIG
ncbi:MAG TPA: hypothetical protein PK089_06000 [Methanoregulaceae archaeon]|nr:hypothetical protein [Methanoregulaceae archaeon]HOV67950.1 hypothetical protein [Methanoregulaceae archaeon]